MDIDDTELTTYADIHALFARVGFQVVRKRDVAQAMGVTPDQFSLVMRDRGGQPSAEWLAQFRRAWRQAVELRAAELSGTDLPAPVPPDTGSGRRSATSRR